MSDKNTPGDPIPYELAVAMLPDGEGQHTFIAGPGMLLGADTSRARVLELLRNGSPRYAPAMLAAMHHRIMVIYEDEAVFIETREE